MPDLQGALETRLFERLSASITGAAVHQHVPQDEQGDLVIIADIDSEDAGTKSSVLRQFNIQISTEVRAQGRKPLNALQAQVDDALNGWRPAPTDDAKFGVMTQQSSTGARGADAETYLGSQSFAIFVQPI